MKLLFIGILVGATIGQIGLGLYLRKRNKIKKHNDLFIGREN
jgi:hypothetical protein